MATFILAHAEARERAVRCVKDAPEGYWVKVEPAKRSLPQNERMWALLEILSAQVVWHGQKLSKEEWKDVCSAALKRQKVVPGIDGGFVVLGSSTSRMSRAEMCELQELIEAFGAQQGVDFDSYHGSRESATA